MSGNGRSMTVKTDLSSGLIWIIGDTHQEAVTLGLPEFDSILNSLDDLGRVHEQVQVVHDEHGVGMTVEPVDCFHRVSDLLQYFHVFPACLMPREQSQA